jgi:cellulose synthase/poly-beta-1,6-N-acetylglucosamine synthase-like glycosyltransferase
MMIEILFMGSILVVVFAYFGYPFSLFLLARLGWQKEVKKGAVLPKTTIIITAHNEEKRILRKLENTVALQFPKEKLQIIVASDGSSDRTNWMVKGYRNKGVTLLEIVERKGKENAQKEALKIAKGDVIVFSDAATILDFESLKEIVSNFADPLVGCVSSEDRLTGKDGKPRGEGFYVRYEMWLRRLESRVNSLVGLSGSFFAVRREVCQNFSGDLQSDFKLALKSVELGFRGVSDPRAIGYYQDVAGDNQEYDRKVRTILRGLTVFFDNVEFLNIFRYGLFSYQYFCHKLLRWVVPFFMLLALAANMGLAIGSGTYQVLLLLQLSFYAAALAGAFTSVVPKSPFVKLPAYFFAVNLAIAVAWWRYIKGDRVVMWTPSER